MRKIYYIYILEIYEKKYSLIQIIRNDISIENEFIDRNDYHNIIS